MQEDLRATLDSGVVCLSAKRIAALPVAPPATGRGAGAVVARAGSDGFEDAAEAEAGDLGQAFFSEEDEALDAVGAELLGDSEGAGVAGGAGGGGDVESEADGAVAEVLAEEGEGEVEVGVGVGGEEGGLAEAAVLGGVEGEEVDGGGAAEFVDEEVVAAEGRGLPGTGRRANSDCITFIATVFAYSGERVQMLHWLYWLYFYRTNRLCRLPATTPLGLSAPPSQ